MKGYRDVRARAASGLGPDLFDSMQRSRQRANAERYVRGLLVVPGRKTLRNIASQFDGLSAEQNVHHFISESPWEWMPIRRSLARRVQGMLEPEAWVINSTVIPKTGSYSVGVDPQYHPHTGRSVNGQRVVGTWMATPRTAVPVDWQLCISGRWLEDPLRTRVAIPATVTESSVETCVRAAVAQAVSIGGLPGGPFVIDAVEADTMALTRYLLMSGSVFVVRVAPETLLRLDRAELPRYGDREQPAGELAAALTRLRRRVNSADGPMLAAAIPVVMPRSSGGRRMTLVAERAEGMPDRLWLTSAHTLSVASVLRLTRLVGVVARGFSTTSEAVGMLDFAGRSYPGWHRHMTLASVAHMAAALNVEGSPTEGGGS
ncbi:IS701 family transposase [Streptomyces sp. NPDC055107]